MQHGNPHALAIFSDPFAQLGGQDFATDNHCRRKIAIAPMRAARSTVSRSVMPFPQYPRAATGKIDITNIFPAQRLHHSAATVRTRRRYQQMHMVGHQYKGMNRNSELLGRNLQLLQIKSVITLIKKQTSRLFPRWIIWCEHPGTYNLGNLAMLPSLGANDQNSTSQKNHFLSSIKIKDV